MAIRIPVVISQHERRSGAIADYEEQLITRVVLESGLDATLIADLKSIKLDTTDHLCIEGLKGDFALATWETAEYACTHLHRLGIPSIEIIPVDGSERSVSGESTIAKKIFLISLATDVSIDKTLSTLKGLLQARSTPVFSIGAPIQRAKSEIQAVRPVPPAEQTMRNVKVADTMVPRLPQANRVVLPADLNLESDFPNIDQLMEDLDQFEI